MAIYNRMASEREQKQETVSEKFRYHFFLSHASEEKEQCALPLKEELELLGCKVWLDCEEMAVGESVVKGVNVGLKQSRYMVAIISRAYLDKRWTKAEFERGLGRTVEGTWGRILPIRHRMTHEELAEEVPLLEPLLTLSTETSPRRLASALVRAMSKEENRETARTTAQLRALAGDVPIPNGVDALNYLRELAKRSTEPEQVTVTPQQSRHWGIVLFFCLLSALLGASGLAYWLYPQYQEESTRALNLKIEKDGLIRDVNGLNNQLETEKKQLAAKADEVTNLVSTRDKLQNELTAKIADLEKALDQNSKQKEQIVNEGLAIAKLQGELTSLNTKLDNAVKQGLTTKEKLEAETKQKEAFDSQLHFVHQRTQLTDGELNRRQKLIDELRNKLSAENKSRVTAERKLEKETASLKQAHAELEGLKKQPAEIKIFNVAATHCELVVIDDDVATTTPETVRGDSQRLFLRKPNGSKAVLLLLGGGNTVPNSDDQLVLAVPIQEEQAEKIGFYYNFPEP